MPKIAMESITPSSIYDSVRFGFSERFLEACKCMALGCFFPALLRYLLLRYLDDEQLKEREREHAELKSCLKDKYKNKYKKKYAPEASPNPERNRRVNFSPELPEREYATIADTAMLRFKKYLEELFHVKLNTRVAPVPPGKTQGQYLTHEKFIELLAKELRERKIQRYHSGELWDMFTEFAANN